MGRYRTPWRNSENMQMGRPTILPMLAPCGNAARHRGTQHVRRASSYIAVRSIGMLSTAPLALEPKAAKPVARRSSATSRRHDGPSGRARGQQPESAQKARCQPPEAPEQRTRAMEQPTRSFRPVRTHESVHMRVCACPWLCGGFVYERALCA